MFEPMVLSGLRGLDSTRTLVLTVNNRTARRIVAALSASLDEGQRVMALPDILPLGAWLRQASDAMAFEADAGLASYVLDAFAAKALWQKAIEEVEHDNVLLDTAQAARLAQEADRLQSEWRLEVDPAEATVDYERFLLWRECYLERLQQLDAHDANQVTDCVYGWYGRDGMPLPFDQLVLAGFNEVSPRLESALSVFQQRGVTVYRLDLAAERALSVRRLELADSDAEWRAAAAWAVQQLQSNPQKRYAIVAPQLESEVPFVHRVLQQAMARAGSLALPYNVAVARPLAEWPVVRAALAWLRLLGRLMARHECTPELAGAALLAGHCVGDTEEAGARASMDAQWRHQRTVRLTSASLAQDLATYAPQLHAAWVACFELALQLPKAATLDQWAVVFRQWLQQLGFPGGEALDSARYQAMEAFERLLLQYAQQALVFDAVSVTEATSWLASLAAQTLFQPQADARARLDVQGFLEAEGGRWDGVWVLGLTADALPAAVKPNPLLPLVAQRRANTPRSTPERELQWAQTLYQTLLCSASELVFSSAAREGEQVLYPSPLIAGLPLAKSAEAVLDGGFVAGGPDGAAAIVAAGGIGLQTVQTDTDGLSGPVLEAVVDNTGPPLPQGQRTRGGSGVIEAQARNPLWAFVKYRLGAAQLPAYAELFDQNARGLFLHDSMETLFQGVESQAALARLQASGELDALCEEAIQSAADGQLRDYSPRLRELEVARARTLINTWIGLELQRPPFVVRGVEQTLEWSFGPLDLRLRIDRMDALETGGLAVIDYKTGATPPRPKPDWMRDRPVNLQLPLYAAVLADAAGADAVRALVFAHLYAAGPSARGLADDDSTFGAVEPLSGWTDYAPNWDALLAGWKTLVEGLAQEYMDGVAVNQVHKTSDLDYCDVLPFLRLASSAALR